MSSVPFQPSALSVELGELARELALQAGEIVRQQADRTATIAAKTSVTDLVTEVDRAVERFLIDSILARRPADSIVGE
jgi:myo-inositol-1(or 4)-monophosphatase